MKQSHGAKGGAASSSVSLDQFKQKVRELDVSTNYVHNILQHIAQGMLFVNFSGIIIGYNQAAEGILEQSAVDVLFCPYSVHFDDCAFGFSIKEALTSQKVPSEPLLVKQGATERVLEVQAYSAIHDKSHPLPSTRAEDLDFTNGILFFFRDVTVREAKRQQEERSARLRQLGEMVASIAHEVRNPLGGIKGFASILERDLAKEPHLQKMAHYILEGTNHLNRLIDTMLQYARPLTPMRQPIDLVVFLFDFIYHVRMDSNLQQVDYSVDFTEGSLYANIDTGLFHEALLNLITNAVQAMPQKGSIVIGLHKRGGHAVIEIIDTGEGISKENMEKIFQPFFTTKAKGSGFGLSETLKIVQAHQGAIEMESVLGKGTHFRLVIPLIKHEEKK